MKIDPRAKDIVLNADSDREFFLVHGYSGSPTDFSDLPNMLHKEFNANVRVILLKGHGTRIEDLDNLDYEDFMEQTERELEKELKKGRQIVAGGISFGSYPALKFAAKYHLPGVFNIEIPYRLRFPLNLPGLKFLSRLKRSWGSCTPDSSTKYFSYPTYHSNGLGIIIKANKEAASYLPLVKSPCLTIHSLKDKISHYKGAYEIDTSISSEKKELDIFDNGRHNIFFTDQAERAYQLIISFFKRNKVFRNAGK